LETKPSNHRKKKDNLNYLVEDLQAKTEAKRFSTVHVEQILPWKKREINMQTNVTDTTKKKKKERPVPIWHWIDQEDEDDEEPYEQDITENEVVPMEEEQMYEEQSEEEEAEEDQFEEATGQQESKTTANDETTDTLIWTPDRTKTGPNNSKNKGFLSLLTDSWTQFKNTSPTEKTGNSKALPETKNKQLHSTPM
jgi:hypothetical protein